MITNLVGPPVRGTNFYGREAFANLASDKLRDWWLRHYGMENNN